MGKRGMTPTQARRKRLEMGLPETKLQKLRVKKGYSQTELAAISGVPMRRIQKYEQQVVPIDGAKLNTLCALSLALDCKIEDMLENKSLIEKFRLAK